MQQYICDQIKIINTSARTVSENDRHNILSLLYKINSDSRKNLLRI